MDEIDSTSALLLGIAVLVVVVLVVGWLAGTFTEWRRRRRDQREFGDGPVVDLTFFHETTERYKAASGLLREGVDPSELIDLTRDITPGRNGAAGDDAEVSEPRSTSPEGGGR